VGGGLFAVQRLYNINRVSARFGFYGWSVLGVGSSPFGEESPLPVRDAVLIL